MSSLVIRNGTIVDGSGGDPYEADLSVEGGRIDAIGKNLPKGAEEINARGKLVTPGFVDVHTHYDAQITWDATLSPSVALGVTTAVMGNCGFGIAPCPAPLRETLLRNLSVVEGMDVDALLAGTRWDFETFPQYLEML